MTDSYARVKVVANKLLECIDSLENPKYSIDYVKTLLRCIADSDDSIRADMAIADYLVEIDTFFSWSNPIDRLRLSYSKDAAIKVVQEFVRWNSEQILDATGLTEQELDRFVDEIGRLWIYRD